MHDITVQALTDFAAEGGIRVKLRGSCMAPVLADGATVSVRPRRLYLPGDVLVFRTHGGNLAAHRFLGWRPAGLVMKGDACLVQDAPVRRDSVIGRVDVDIPLLSRIRALADFARIIVRRLTR